MVNNEKINNGYNSEEVIKNVTAFAANAIFLIAMVDAIKSTPPMGGVITCKSDKKLKTKPKRTNG